MAVPNMINYLKTASAGVLALILCMIHPFAAGDQNDPRLDSLFAELHTAIDQDSANAITDEIWKIWRQSPDEEINLLMGDGVRAMSAGRLRQALKIFDEIVLKAPEFAEGWNKRATVHYFLRQYEQSANDVRQTLLLEPRHFGATAGLGLIFLSLDYPKSALEAFEKALELNPHLVGPKMQIQRLEKYLLDDPV